MKIDNIDFRGKQLNEIVDQMHNNPNCKLYIWGCSQTAHMITEFIHGHSTVEVEAYIVDDEYFDSSTFLNKQILKRTMWQGIVKEGDIVVFGFVGYVRAKELSLNMPMGVRTFYFSFPYSANAYGTCLSYHQYCEHKQDYEMVYNLLADQLSKDIMEMYINASITGNIDLLENYRMDGQYFNDLTQNYDVKCFVDCGAYIGDTIEEVVRFYPSSIAKIIAFEPDRSNISVLKEKIKNDSISEDMVCVVPRGTWSHDGALSFSSTGSSSAISDEGDFKIEVTDVDSVCLDLNPAVDYIKMDVEGSEAETLIGAQKIIQQFHPILAVCVYHKPEDIYALPQQILNIIGDFHYKFYLRYHGPDLRELVLYAIPSEDNGETDD